MTINFLHDKNVVILIIILLIISFIAPNISGNLIHRKMNTKIIIRAPGEEWNRTFGGINYDYGQSVKQTDDGGYIICGTYNWTYPQNNESNDIFLVKTDEKGIEEWNRTFGGTDEEWGYDVEQTSDGGYIITGETDSYGPCIYSSAWLIKTDGNGYEQWNNTFGRENLSSSSGIDVQETEDKGFIIIGNFGTSIYVIKTNSSGIEEWYRIYSRNYSDYGRSIQQTLDGGYILTGTTYETTFGDSDIWLIKTDNTGKINWSKTFGSETQETNPSVRQTIDGGFIISAGWIINDDRTDAILLKTDNTGEIKWTRKFGGASIDYVYTVRQTKDNGFIFVGRSYSFGTGSLDVWLIKTDKRGYEQWNITFGTYRNEWGKSVEETNDGGFIICGSTNSYGVGNYDMWLIKYKPENQPPNVEIINPKEGFFHLSGKPIIPTFFNLINDTMSLGGFRLSPIVINASDDRDNSENLTVNVYLNGEYKGEASYCCDWNLHEWFWTGPAYGIYNLTITAMDSDSEISSTEMDVWNFCIIP